jgi:hypothetical protein
MLHYTNCLKTYNLISQRDNDVNVKIAEATQRDSAVQKEIAEFMKDIAVRTYYDSATMKAMALITLCCLPGTLAAVCNPSYCNFVFAAPR